MELVLTKDQKKYLDKKGPFTARELKETYKQSVKDQKRTLKEAKKIKNSK